MIILDISCQRPTVGGMNVSWVVSVCPSGEYIYFKIYLCFGYILQTILGVYVCWIYMLVLDTHHLE